MRCWKCDRPINYGSECDECATGGLKYSFPQFKESKEIWVSIDWRKVKTIEDIKYILSCINIKVKKDNKDPIYIKLKGYLIDD